MTDNQESGPSRVTIGSLFRRRGFWLNFVITLLLTCWIPLLTLKPHFEIKPVPTQEAANTSAIQTTPAPLPPEDQQPVRILEGEPRRVPLYECYAGLGRLLMKGDFGSRALRIYGGAVAAHLVLCFAISLWVWFIVLRNAAKNDQES